MHPGNIGSYSEGWALCGTVIRALAVGGGGRSTVEFQDSVEQSLRGALAAYRDAEGGAEGGKSS